MVLLFSILITALHPIQAAASDDERKLDEQLSLLSRENAEGYINPLLKSIAFNLNRSLYHTAEIKGGTEIYLGLKAMAAVVPAHDKSYSAVSPIDGSQKTTATIVGGQGSSFDADRSVQGEENSFPDGFNWSVIPIYVPQLHIGNILGTQFIIRYLPSTKFDDKIGDIDVLGGGVQHSLSQYVSGIPFDLSVQGMFQMVKLGSHVEGTGQTYSLIASTSYSSLTFYGGVGMESTDFSIRYDYSPPPNDDQEVPAHAVEFASKVEERFRGNLGLSLKFVIFNINADYTFGDYKIASIGLGIAI